MKRLFEKLKQKYVLLKNDRKLTAILLLHLLLIALHLYHNILSDIEYYCYIRVSGCALISILIFFMGRKGLAYGLTVYACVLIHINMFYNYSSIFFILIAIGANPKIKIPVLIIYIINVIIAFSIKGLIIVSFLIHDDYIALFILLFLYVFTIHTPDRLNLTDDERAILKELLNGKKQKEIELFSQQTITAKLKSARERNMCETTAELVSRFYQETTH